MSGKDNYNGYSVTQGGIGNIIADPHVNRQTRMSGAAEPNWPAVEYATIVDGGVTWTAIYARKTVGTVTGVLNAQVFQHNKLVFPNHFFQYGVLLWLTGRNAGFTTPIRDSFGPVTKDGQTSKPYIFSLELAPNPIDYGDTFQATVGCNKTRYMCQLFNNMDNHRGFPDMPTEERALATPNISNQGYSPRTTK
jgi:hypothetical protein